MPTQEERAFPVGHPASPDYDPDSPEAIEWRRKYVHPKGERDFPVGHPKAVDTEGNTNHVAIVPGVDPARPQFEAFTGRSPEVAERMKEINAELSQAAFESPVLEPTEAPAPPKATVLAVPAGQPSDSVVRNAAMAWGQSI